MVKLLEVRNTKSGIFYYDEDNWFITSKAAEQFLFQKASEIMPQPDLVSIEIKHNSK